MPVGDLIEIAVRVDGKRLGEETLAYYKRILEDQISDAFVAWEAR